MAFRATKKQIAALLGEKEKPKDPTKKPRRPRTKKKFAESAFFEPATWVVGIELVSEANRRDHWRTTANRKKTQRAFVNHYMTKQEDTLFWWRRYYETGGTVQVTICRLGGRKLDPTSNLPSSTKACEDQVAELLGANDGDERWKCIATQEPGPLIGVRITLRMISS